MMKNSRLTLLIVILSLPLSVSLSTGSAEEIKTAEKHLRQQPYQQARGIVYGASIEPTAIDEEEPPHVRPTVDEYASKINTPGIEDVPLISKDGKKLYFHYSIYKFSDLKKGRRTIIGPLRNGRTLRDFEQAFFIGYVSEKVDGRWQEPTPIKFADQRHAWGSVDISEDGRYMYTIGPGSSKKNRMDIFVHKLRDGIWSNPERVKGINTESIEDDPDIAKDNTFLVWDSDRPDGYGMRDIWYSEKLPNGEWAKPKNLGRPINSEYNEQYPFLTEDGNTIYFNRAIPSEVMKGRISIFVSENIDGEWSEPTELDLSVNIALSPSLTSDEKTIFFETGNIQDNDPSTLFDSNFDIYYSVRQSDGLWSEAQPVDYSYSIR